jgi:hypothetical protein
MEGVREPGLAMDSGIGSHLDGLYAIQIVVGDKGIRYRVYRDDLPVVKISRLRATGVVTEAMTETTVWLGDVTATVGLWHLHFPNGGGWSYFLCPGCGQKAQRLRVLNGRLFCRRCLLHRGVRSRLEPLSVRQRAELRAPELMARLGSVTSERLKPMLWGTMERRKRHEASLARCEFIISQKSRRYRDVVTEEIPSEPIARPKIKTTR